MFGPRRLRFAGVIQERLIFGARSYYDYRLLYTGRLSASNKQPRLTVLYVFQLITTNKRDDFGIIVWNSTDVEVRRQDDVSTSRRISDCARRVDCYVPLRSISRRQSYDVPLSVTDRHGVAVQHERVLPSRDTQPPRQRTVLKLQEEVGTRATERKQQETVCQLRPEFET